jgi:hypothetical protein
MLPETTDRSAWVAIRPDSAALRAWVSCIRRLLPAIEHVELVLHVPQTGCDGSDPGDGHHTPVCNLLNIDKIVDITRALAARGVLQCDEIRQFGIDACTRPRIKTLR